MATARTQPVLPVARESWRWSSIARVGGAKPSHLLLACLLLVFFAVFLIWPILNVVATGFRTRDGAFTLEYLRLIVTNPVLLRGLGNATLIAVLTTLLTLLIALPLAVLGVRYEFRGRGVMSALMLVPMILPPFVGAVGMRLVLSRFGPLTMLTGAGGETGFDWLAAMKLAGVVVVEALGLYPIMLLNLQAALANIDPAMEQAAANLGASRWTVFRRITLPLIRPGLFAGCTLVLIWSFTELGTPLMFQFYEVTPVQVFSQITELDNPLPYALVVVMLAASTLLYVVGKVLLGRGFDAATTKASVQFTPTRLRGWRGVVALAPFVVVFALAVLPHVSVVLT
ncbi:MAG TPA: ABC transporter permease subunit, partial [Tepidisphaeraceae bacterium]|nr:ABC transporter permease subunit [Tepidisphaeraceae bacterium]